MTCSFVRTGIPPAPQGLSIYLNVYNEKVTLGVRPRVTRKQMSTPWRAAIFFFLRCENQMRVDNRASGIALSPNPSQIHVCAINALPESATIDDGRVAEWFKAPVLKVAGLGVIPYRLVRHSADFRGFPPSDCLADAVL